MKIPGFIAAEADVKVMAVGEYQKIFPTEAPFAKLNVQFVKVNSPAAFER